MSSLVGPLVLSPDSGYRVWEDPSFIKWRKRESHVTLHCRDSVEGSLKYWYKRNQVDHLVSKSAVWNDDAIDEALDCCAFWVKDLPFVKSLSGHWKFFLADSPTLSLIKFLKVISRIWSGNFCLGKKYRAVPDFPLDSCPGFWQVFVTNIQKDRIATHNRPQHFPSYTCGFYGSFGLG
ncbi:PREDICTED: uncharacterized protein LOC109328089 isoform X1 [Lupinus angustifolius]|uniref:uncharacterized protein LOC109328089 isoform X1 n=1 Tax=Lupinus angustifolius TaxID=3871 RepID=UPI00092FD1F4|nr:PREDICTED: uncharacterized protein LOC109328089 isoform X1 [Lupinus angustifolius]